MGWWDRGRAKAGYDPVEPVIVALRTGNTVKGVAIVIGPEGMVLVAAKIAGVGQNGQITWSAMAGEVVLSSDNIDYWQRGIGMEMVE